MLGKTALCLVVSAALVLSLIPAADAQVLCQYTGVMENSGPAAPPPVYRLAQEQFPDYQPKLSPDTVLDYRPVLAPKLAGLPPASLEALPFLLQALEEYRELARAHPGREVQGHPGLGADPVEYRPSDEELLAAETGARIARVAAGAARDELAEILKKAGVTAGSIEYEEFTFRHVDVMGSGRYFYASFPKTRHVTLTGK